MTSPKIAFAMAVVAAFAYGSPAMAPPLVYGPPESLNHRDAPPPAPPSGGPAGGTATDGHDLACLAETVYWEARGETETGQLAVAHVVLNRVNHPGFADTICGVVYQGVARNDGEVCQFQWVCGQSARRPKDRQAWDRARDVAERAIAGADPTDGALYFHVARLGKPWGRERYREARVIGGHVFLR